MQNKPLNVTMRELLAKLDEKPSVEEGFIDDFGKNVIYNPVKKAFGKSYDFIKSLGKGGTKDAFTEAVKAAQKEADDALANAVMQKPRITTADIAAARAEGITTQDWLLKNKPEFYAILGKAEPEAQAAFFNIVSTTAKDYQPPDRNLKTAAAVSIIGHIIVIAILSWKTKYLPSSSSSSSSNNAKSSLPFAKGATYQVRADSVDWESLGAPGFKGQGATLNPDGKWTARDGTAISDPKLVAGLDAALQQQLSKPMTVRVITQAQADAERRAKINGETPILTTKNDSAVKRPVDPKRRPDLKID